MKITIDTKEDSPEEIKNAIKMLSSLVGEKSYTNQPNIFEDSSPEVSTPQGNVFGNIFEDTQSKSEAETTEETKTEDKEDTPSVTEYY